MVLPLAISAAVGIWPRVSGTCTMQEPADHHGSGAPNVLPNFLVLLASIVFLGVLLNSALALV